MQEQNQQVFRKKLPIPLKLLFIVGTIVLLFFNTTFFTKSSKLYIPETVEVVMANQPLPAATTITNEHISVEKVSKDELPKGKLVSATSVVGRILAVSVYEGQILTESCLAPQGSAAAIGDMEDMRALSVIITSRSMPDRALLSPGCRVDVLVSYKLPSDSTEGEALSTTMLRGIQVLAVSGELVVTEPTKGEEENTKSKKSGESKVTLLVTTRQAEALSLALNNGDISLTIRNPNDKKEFDEDPSILNKRKLTPRGAELPPAVLLSVPMESNVPAEQRTKYGNKFDNSRNPLREITVIRDRKVQTASSK